MLLTSNTVALLIYSGTEGDRKAFLESSKATRKQNEETINDLRKKNKQMAARLKALKVSLLIFD